MNWPWSLRHLGQSVSRGSEMNFPRFPSWPMTCCDGWFCGTLLCQLGHPGKQWLCWHWGAFSLQLRQIMLSFNLWVKVQSGMEDSIRALAPNRTTTSQLEQHCSTQLISCWSCTHLFEKNTSHVLPIKGTYISHFQAFFRNRGKEKVVKTVKYLKNRKWHCIHGIHLRAVP